MKGAMTIDVEDYFQVSAFESVIDRNEWDTITPRVEKNTHHLLDKFDKYNINATFFMLGWVAKRYPDIARAIVDAGHELASHGSSHRRVTEQNREEFQADVGDAKKLLEDISGKEIKGYRAPSFSFTKDNLWVYEVLAEEGYQYSSSVYPVKHDLYGIPDAPRFSYQTAPGVLEIPLSTLSIMNKNIPISGGGFFRLYPYWLMRMGIRRFIKRESKPYI